VQVNGQPWQVHAVGGSPAQAVLHGILEILKEPPDLVVAGINYGENVATGVTISGTVGAALEAASLGIPSLAISLETDPQHHLSYSEEVDFSTAAWFTTYFGRMILEKRLPPEVDVLKVEVPCDATPDTPWVVTRLSRMRYYVPTRPERDSWNVTGKVGYRRVEGHLQDAEDTDVYALRELRKVAVTPLSLDMTSRIDLKALDRLLRQG
jgi:5'-nucleotidase